MLTSVKIRRPGPGTVNPPTNECTFALCNSSCVTLTTLTLAATFVIVAY